MRDQLSSNERGVEHVHTIDEVAHDLYAHSLVVSPADFEQRAVLESRSPVLILHPVLEIRPLLGRVPTGFLERGEEPVAPKRVAVMMNDIVDEFAAQTKVQDILVAFEIAGNLLYRL